MKKLFSRVKTGFLCLLILLIVAGGAGVFTGRTAPGARAQVVLQEQAFLPLIQRGVQAPPLTDRTVAAEYFSDNTYSFQRSTIFWFGRVNMAENYADVRVGYTDTVLSIALNIFDRYLWYDQEPSSQDLADWDSVTLYLSTAEQPGSQPSPSETQWVAALNHWQPREDYQAALRGNGTGWVSAALPFTTESDWRGEGLNDNGPDANDKGWLVTFHIPFSSLGISAPPHGAMFRLGVALHDRDVAVGSLLADKVWPESLAALNPASWGGLHLGQLPFEPAAAQADGTTVIRNGSQGAEVKDAHVGGAFDCGESVGYDWSTWGNTNYELLDPTQVNIQNQRDVSDWPCFSKYYITFPLDQLPPGAEIVSASLTLFHFGNSQPQDAYASNIHLLSVQEDWTDTTITWNNAPLAWTNYTRLRVEPLLTYPGWPGIPVTWDASLAVQHALEAGGPLRLALYSSDDPMHSGKYFFTSDSGVNTLAARPYLTINWAYP